MKEAIDTSPSRRQVLQLAAMVTACAVAAKGAGTLRSVKLQQASHMTMPIIAQGCGETLRSLTDIVAGLRPYLP